MKKYTLILAIGVSLTLMACGSGSTATETTDSTLVGVDTTKATTDTTVSGGVVGGAQETPVEGKPQQSLEEVK